MRTRLQLAAFLLLILGSTVGAASGIGTTSSAVQPGYELSGSGVITWTSGAKTFTLSLGAFTAGATTVTAAQTITGVAFGDTCTVTAGTDQSACIGQLSARVSAAGSVKIFASAITTSSTCTPTASTVYTVRCFR